MPRRFGGSERRGVAILLPLLCVLGGIALLALAVSRGDGSRPLSSAAAQAATSTPVPSPRVAIPGIARDGPLPTATPTPSPTPTPTPPPRPTSPEGLRAWSSGDSTSYFMSVAVLQMLNVRGAVQVQPEAEYKISSGLLSPGFFNWPAYLASQMAAYDADIVVFMVGANDAHPGIDLDNYRALVAGIMDQLQRPNRVLAWVGQPIMGPNRPDLNTAIPGMNAVFAEEAAVRPWVVYVDAWSLTTDANGNYDPSIRASDGVHFSGEGGRRLAAGVMAALFGE